MLLTPIVALFVLEESMTTVELNGDSPNPDFPKPRYIAEGSGMEFFLCYIRVKLNVSPPQNIIRKLKRFLLTK